jgi:beta-glucanase (GH16 family)
MLGLAKFLPRLAEAESTGVDLSKYTLTVAEEFNNHLSVSAWGPGTTWIAHTPWNGDFGDATFVDPDKDFPFRVAGSRLIIEARKFSDGRFRSGLLASADCEGNGFTQQYGYFEMRAKLPKGPGLWPAFWLVGRQGTRYTAEIDVMEHYGHFPERFTSSVHVWDRQDPSKHVTQYKRISVSPGSLYVGYHIYAASVEADYIRIFFDGNEVWSVPTPPQHHQPLTILLDLGLGGGWPIDKAPSPALMYVDYVRAWKRR